MTPDLIVYNYCPAELSQPKAVGVVKGLLDELLGKGVDTSFLRVFDGNAEFKETKLLIEKLLEY